MYHRQGYFLCLILVFITYVVSEQKSERQLDSYHPCREDGDCKKQSENSICVGNNVETDGVCTCKKDYVMQRNRTYFECLLVINNIVDPCRDHIQCEIHFGNWAHCSSGRCGCREGAHVYNNKCYETVRLNGTCNVNENCLLKDNQIAFCTDGKCKCDYRTTHQYVDETGQSCERNRHLGENCTNTGECSVTEHARCVGVCKCKPGFTTDFKQTTCLRAAVIIGDSCKADDQCDGIEESICEIGKCICRRGFHAYNNLCYKDVKLRNACGNIGECLIQSHLQGSVNCTAGICACAEGYSYSEADKTCYNSAHMKTSTWILSATLCSLILLYNK